MGNEAIQAELKHLMEEQQEVDLMNFYQALPLTYRGVILEVGEEDAALIVQPPDSVCLTWESQTYLLAPAPLDLLQADVASFDIASGIVRLCNLRYGGSHLGHRMITRVMPKEPLQVDMQAGKTMFTTALLDLSSRGAKVQAAAVQKGVQLRKGLPVMLNFHLPEGQVEAQCVVQAVVSSGEEQHIAVVFDDTATDIRPIWQYISYRRMEILQELQDKYLAAYLQQAASN